MIFLHRCGPNPQPECASLHSQFSLSNHSFDLMKKFLLSLAALALATTAALAQLSITDGNPVVVDFTGYEGLGVQPGQNAGYLNSNTWRMEGFSTGTSDFGDTFTTGDYAKGVSTGGVSGGGMYGFNVGGDTALGFQPTGSDFSPGALYLRIQNNTGGDITQLDVSYTLWINNNEARGNSFDFAYSTDSTSYTDVSVLDYISGEASQGSVLWVDSLQMTSITGITIADGDYMYLRWDSDDVSGSGSRDEFAIDDITLTATTSGGGCGVASNLGYTMPEDTSVIITWDTVAGAQSYKILYKVAGNPTWTNVAFKYQNQGQLLLTGLTASTVYKFVVQANCGSGFGTNSMRGRFVTLAAPCSAPAGLSSMPVGATKARLNWSTVSGARKYRIRYREQGGSWTYKLKGGAKDRHWLTGLMADTAYEWQIQSICQVATTDGGAWSALQMFSTQPLNKAQDFAAVDAEEAHNFATIFPNPSNGVVNVAASSTTDGALTVHVMNVAGQQVMQTRVAAGTTAQLDLSAFGTGLYLVRMADASNVTVARVVVQ